MELCDGWHAMLLTLTFLPELELRSAGSRRHQCDANMQCAENKFGRIFKDIEGILKKIAGRALGYVLPSQSKGRPR
jgi:hypothetical protein